MSSTQVADALLDEAIDVGIMRPLPLPDALSEIELSREPLVAVLSSKHPLAQGSDKGLFLASLAEEPFVFFPRSYGSGLYAQLLTLARDAGFSPHFAQEAGEAMTIIGLVAAGLGVSVLPASYQRMRIDGVVYRSLLDPAAVSAVWLVQRKDQRSPMAKAFVALLTGVPE
jgi:DNA-binding transcriptional LysR family regulator